MKIDEIQFLYDYIYSMLLNADRVYSFEYDNLLRNFIDS